MIGDNNLSGSLTGDQRPPPCELPYPRFEQHRHPRFPSGDCVVCGALCTEGCKHELAVGEYAPREG